MFVKRRERAHHWEAGYKPGESEAEPVPSPPLSAPAGSAPLTAFAFAPKLPSGDTVVDPEKLDAMSSEELERVLLFEKKSTHNIVAPQVQ